MDNLSKAKYKKIKEQSMRELMWARDERMEELEWIFYYLNTNWTLTEIKTLNLHLQRGHKLCLQ